MKAIVRSQLVRLAQLTACLMLPLIMSACTSGTDASSKSPFGDSISVTGSAVKGVISNGLVSVYDVTLQSGVMAPASNPAIENIRTDSQGRFSFSLDAVDTSAIFMLEVTTDEQSRMLCDVPEGCGNDANGNPLLFGDEITLDSDFLMSSIALVPAGSSSVTAAVSPLTHMAIARAKSELAGMTEQNLLNSFAYVEDLFDLDRGALFRAPIDITRPESLVAANESDVEYAVISASILSLVNGPDWGSISEVMDHVSARLEAGGEIASVNLGALRDVALDDIYYAASEIALELSTNAEYSAHAQVLSDINQVADQTYQALSQSQEQIVPASITTNPVSKTVDEGDRTTFTVAAQGSGPLAFQWRKDGVALSGQNQSTLVISSAEVDDAGAYDVIVSNSAGATTSFSAELAVIATPENQLVSIDLLWDIPTQRQDGAPLALYEIEGYVIQYGTVSGALTESVQVAGATQTQATLENLQKGNYFFAIATIDSEGVRGEFSQEIAQTL